MAEALNVTLGGSRSAETKQTSPEAYNVYLQGRYFYDRRSKEDVEKAIAYYDSGLTVMKEDPLLRSLERDSRYPAFLKK